MAEQASDLDRGFGQGLFHTTLMLAWLGSQLPTQPPGLGDVREILRHGYRTRQP